ncbi:malonyl-ACP O-methyltransferase BioC [Marinomonas sp. C2222]|uniref:Malonyl-[acyl-carrier protein] O-methyltransferase n=1 Tax=Marinomonas sargassi TaxID=2984494 RepID=A0ABT2YND8_9GAMM|nr:malonyl-ACP O-methyltransferase BioC [Marinomonas sargassi]MCV2401403.1 malonyl-ACP O-methyltransferase BioC [Marinomonas sargassi]
MLINEHPEVLNYKRQLVKHFDRASLSYDTYAEFQRVVLDRLLPMLPSGSYDRVLDLGAGTGQALSDLIQKTQPSFCLALDLSCQMLSVAQSRFPELDEVHYLCADAESLPLANGSLDLAFSSLAIQWSLSPEALFDGLFQVLKPGGYFVFSTLLENSMPEIEGAWSAIGSPNHVHRYVSSNVLSGQLEEANFKVLSLYKSKIAMQFDSPESAINSLKKVGASLIRSDEHNTVSPSKWKAFIKEYERQRSEEGIPLSYQVAFVVVQKPY